MDQRRVPANGWIWPLFGAAVIDALDRTGFHIGIVSGLAAVFCLLIFTAGWRKWAATSAPESLAGEMISLAFVASTGAMLLGYGFKGSLAVYLPGGFDEGSYPNENLLSVFMFNDFAPYIAWYGVAMPPSASPGSRCGRIICLPGLASSRRSSH